MRFFVVTPVRNAERKIGRTIRSILGQTSLASAPESAPLPRKRWSGFTSTGFSACFSLMPWQPTQPKLRESAATA